MRTIHSSQITTATIADGEIIADEYGDPYIRLTGTHKRGEHCTSETGRRAHIVMSLSNGLYALDWDDAHQRDWTPRTGRCEHCGKHRPLHRAADMSGIPGMVCIVCDDGTLSLA